MEQQLETGETRDFRKQKPQRASTGSEGLRARAPDDSKSWGRGGGGRAVRGSSRCGRARAGRFWG